MASFTHDNARFTLDHLPDVKLSNRVPAGDDELADRLMAASRYTGKLTRRETVAWFVARLNFLTSGEIQQRFDSHNSDTGSFFLPLVVDAGGKPSGIFSIHGYAEQIVLRGGRDEAARDPRLLLIEAMVAEPDWLEPCRVKIVQPETKKRWYCGWDGGQLVVG